MKHLALLAAGCLCASWAQAEFVHPGVAHSADSIAFVRSRIEAKEQPWADAWEKVRASREASLSWNPRPREHVERGPYNNPDIGSSEFSDDAEVAYVHALCWTLTGDEAHAGKSAEIVDAWSGALKSIGNHDARLLVGMSGYKFCIAAELLEHTWDGWPAASRNRFEAMLRDIWYPIIQDFYPSANGNWDASMLQTMLAMGVVLDDRAMFDRAKNYFLTGAGNGAIGNYFKESGQCQESGRDQGHTQMGLEFLANTCETAWIQGVDLYGALDNRLLEGFEYTAKYNLGEDVPYEPYRSFQGRYHYKAISGDGRGRFRPMYEKVFNHYHNRKGLEAPFTRRVVERLRAGGGDGGRSRRWDGAALDTLLFAEHPRKERDESPARRSKEAPKKKKGTASRTADPEAWQFEPNPDLPNVLILGDSISIGYTLAVRGRLEGKANVFRPMESNGNRPENCSGTTFGVENLDRWIKTQKWDVIHFNWGLHDLKHVKTPGANDNSNDPKDPTQATLEKYARNMETIAGKLEATGARLVFATTTPVVEGTLNPLRAPEAPISYNAAAVRIMEAKGIRVNDLHAYCLPHLDEWQLPKNVHFKPQGSAELARRVAAVIAEELARLK